MLEIVNTQKLIGRVIVTTHQWVIAEVRETEGNKYRFKCYGPAGKSVEFALMRNPFKDGVHRLYNDTVYPNKIEVKIETIKDMNSFVEVLRNELLKVI
jgi:hypothetical protein